jgi:hypothetical protein
MPLRYVWLELLDSTAFCTGRVATALASVKAASIEEVGGVEEYLPSSNWEGRDLRVCMSMPDIEIRDS